MIRNLARQWAIKLSSCQYMNEEQQEELSYSIECFVASGLQLCIVLGIGVALRKLAGTAVFLATWIPVRSYAGGFHAQNRALCTLIFSAIVFTSLKIAVVLENSIFFHETLCIVLVISTGVLIG